MKIYYLTLNKREHIFKEGTPVSFINIIKSGYVKLYLENKNNCRIFNIAKTGNILGIKSLYTGNSHYSAEALEKTEICYIDHNIFRSLISCSNAFAKETLKHTCLECHNSLINIIKLNDKNIYGKVAEILLYFYCLSGNYTFKILLSRNELANFAGMSRERFTTSLKYFEEEEIIKINKNDIEILNKTRLEKLTRYY